KDIAQQVRFLSQNHVNREKEINDFATNHEVPSQVESAVVRHTEVHGGNGFAAATVQDLGFGPTLGATSADAKPVRRRAKIKTIEVGEGLSAAGVSATGVSTAGVLAGGVSAGAAKRTRRKKGEEVTTGGALLSHKDLDKMHGQPPDTIRAKVTVKAEGMDRAVGSGASGGGRSQRNA
ncbi:MAG: hypothetical protein ACKPKO_02345, partial [Candidatus Fonsibacter sp.]